MSNERLPISASNYGATWDRLVLLPLPAGEAIVESVEHGASAYIVTLRVVSATEEVEVQTRWKDRDGSPMVVEVSHLSRTAVAEAPIDDAESTSDGELQR